jgi:outer membrane protein assembly factor BamB
MLGGCPKRASYAPRAATYQTTVRWAVALGAEASSPAISADGFLWVGTTGGLGIALSAFYGNLLTAVKLGADPVRSSPAIAANGLAVFGYSDGFVYAVKVGSTTPLDAGDDGDAEAGIASAGQTANAEGPLTSSPAIAKDGSIIVATTNGRVAALRLGDAPKWSVQTDGDGVASPAIGSNGRIYVAGAGNSLAALDGETGGKIWQAPIGAPLLFIAVGGDDSIYVGAADGKLYSVGVDGKSRWTFSTGGAITGAPAIFAGIMYVGSADKKLYAVTTADGQKKWEYATLGAVASPTIAADGTIYFGSSDANLYAVRASGLLYYAVNVKAAITSAPAIGGDGTVYVTTASSIVAVGP